MFRKTALSLAMVMLILSCGLAQAAPIVLKLGHVVEPVASYAQGAALFSKLVKEKKQTAPLMFRFFPTASSATSGI